MAKRMMGDARSSVGLGYRAELPLMLPSTIPNLDCYIAQLAFPLFQAVQHSSVLPKAALPLPKAVKLWFDPP